VRLDTDTMLKETGWRYVVRQVQSILFFRLLRARPKRQNIIAAIPTEFVGERVCLLGTLEPREIALLRKVVAMRNLSSSAFLDIGANIGCYTLAFAGDFAAVYAFEPNGIPLDLLRLNIKLNRLSNVSVFDVGLSDVDGEASFCQDDANLGASHFVQADDAQGTHVKLKLRRGDELLASMLSIGFIKCDVEGMELSVFRGLAKTIERDKPVIFFESVLPKDGQACIDYLRSLGYGTFYMVGENAMSKAAPLRWLTRAISGVTFRLWAIERVEIRHINILAIW
jgi:FkbM family methyltransferase